MDVLSHGLYGGIIAGRKSKKSFIAAFLLGLAPDILSFAPYFFLVLFGVLPRQSFSVEPPAQALMPTFVQTSYDITHSLVVFLLVFGVAWVIARRPVWELGAWGLHILVDIPTHSYDFFPTPFLWPLSSFEVNGHPWGTPEIFIPNVILLVILYVSWYISHRRKESPIRP